jgi:hypothetical protein
MRSLVIVACKIAGLLLCTAGILHAQRISPIRELGPVEAVTEQTFGTLLGVYPLRDGRVLVNDGGRRQVLVLDATLKKQAVLIDSVAGVAPGYGPVASPVIAAFGDSLVFVDGPARSLLLIDPVGRITRVFAAPKTADFRYLAAGRGGTDAQGNLIYVGGHPPATSDSANAFSTLRALLTVPDTAPLVRASFVSGQVDTLAWMRTGPVQRFDTATVAGSRVLTVYATPLAPIDEWAVLADGTVAIVRGQDYHVDFVGGTAPRASASKLPFDWKALSDQDKRALVDSARAARTARPQSASGSTSGGSAAPTPGATRIRVGAVAQVSRDASSPVSVTFEVAEPQELPDYWPPIRRGAVLADRDANLWILPTTSANSRAGELVYDVVNASGALMHRVRLPLGRSIVGFGREGIVYLQKSTSSGWVLEQARLR